jgi:hypothetical protein
MSRHYLKNLRVSLIYLLSFSSLIAASPELSFAMDEEKDEYENESRKKTIPENVKIEDQNLDLDWDVVAKNHEKTAARFEQILKDMEVQDIPSTKEGGLTYAQLILKHREVSTLCEEIAELNKNNVDISIQKNEIPKKLTELYGPLTVEFNPLGILKKIIALRKI